MNGAAQDTHPADHGDVVPLEVPSARPPVAVAATTLATLRRLVRPLDYRRMDECRRVLDWLAAAPGERILDVGCGDGHYDRRMARAGAIVDAIDARPDRLALAARWNPHPRVRLHHMQAEALRFPDRSFDKAVSICVLEHIPDDDGAIRELYRVLRPGGRLVLSCDSLSNPGATDRLRARHAERYAVRHFYTRESLAGLLARNGLKVVRSEYVLTTPVSLALARFTYGADDLGRRRGGWVIKYPVAAIAGTVGVLASRASERLARRNDGGLTLIAEAIREG